MAANAATARAARAREVLMAERFWSARAAGNTALRAAPSNAADAAKKKSLRLTVGVLLDERFEDVQNLFLLAAGHFGNRIKQLPGASPR